MPQSHGPRKALLSSVHPGEILNTEFLRPLGVTQHRLAKAIGVDVRRIHAIVHGQRSITAETTLLLSRFFQNSAKFWMGLQIQYELELEQDRLAEKLAQVDAYRRTRDTRPTAGQGMKTGERLPATPAVPDKRVTEQLNAVYGGDDSDSALDEILGALQFLSLPADDES